MTDSPGAIRAGLHDLPDLEHVRVGPAALRRERPVAVGVGNHRLQVGKPAVRTRVDVAAATVPVKRAPLLGRARAGVVAGLAADGVHRAPVAVLDSI